MACGEGHGQRHRGQARGARRAGKDLRGVLPALQLRLVQAVHRVVAREQPVDREASGRKIVRWPRDMGRQADRPVRSGKREDRSPDHRTQPPLRNQRLLHRRRDHPVPDGRQRGGKRHPPSQRNLHASDDEPRRRRPGHEPAHRTGRRQHKLRSGHRRAGSRDLAGTGAKNPACALGRCA